MDFIKSFFFPITTSAFHIISEIIRINEGHLNVIVIFNKTYLSFEHICIYICIYIQKKFLIKAVLLAG